MNPATIKLAQHTISVIQQELGKLTDIQLETLFLTSVLATCASPATPRTQWSLPLRFFAVRSHR